LHLQTAVLDALPFVQFDSMCAFGLAHKQAEQDCPSP
jgi:hypothetical protein